MPVRKPYLSVVIPCYNEEKNIRLGALNKVNNYLNSQKFDWEVLIVNDGSDDNSTDLVKDFIARKPRYKLINNTHQGKARTVTAGIMKAKGKYVLFTDLDQATPLSEFNKFMPWLENGYEVVIGSRDAKREGAPFLRSLMGPGFALLRSKIIGLADIRDTQCGFKAFKSSAAKKLFKKLKLYGSCQQIRGSNVTAGFDVELIYIAKKMGYKIKEVPVEWHYIETRRVNPLIDSWNGLLDILRIKLLDLQGKYR